MAVKISTIIPCIKLSPFLEESIDSIKKQTIQPDEIILWCNGFKPENNHLNQLLCGTNIKLAISNNLLPMAESWNQAGKLAQGEYIHFLHDDDWIEPQFYEHLLKQLRQAPNIGIWFGSSFNRTNESQAPLYTVSFPNSIFPPPSKLGNWIFCHALSRCVSTVINRQCLYSAGGFDPCLKQYLDSDLFWRVGCDYGSMTSSEIVGNYRIHSSSFTGFDIQNSRQPVIEDLRLTSDLKYMLKKYHGTSFFSPEFLKFYRTTSLGCLRYSLRRGQFRGIFSALDNLIYLLRFQQ